jgi:signal transduction histidine kinase
MRQLLDDLLDYNRTSLDIGIRVTPEPGDLATVCREEIELLRAAMPDSTIEFATVGLMLGTWDASRIKQVVSNLVINATRYGDPSGIVRVSLRGDDAHVRLSVENTGPSIPKELMNSLSSRCAAKRGQIRRARVRASASVCSSCARSRSLMAEVSAWSRLTAERASQ